MKKLGARNYSILTIGIKATGSYVDGYYMVEEQLYTKEADTIFKFLTWVENDKDNRGFGWGNYEDRFKQFLNQNKTTVNAND